MKSFRPIKPPVARNIADVLKVFEGAPTPASLHFNGVRHLRNGRTGRRVYHVPSPKCGGVMQVESGLEKLYAVLLEVDHRCQSYRAQPFEIEGPCGAPISADFVELDWAGVPLVTEIKPEGELRRPSALERIAFMRSVLNAWGVAHQVISSKTLEQEPICSNRTLIYRALYVPSSRGLINSGRRFLCQQPFQTVNDAREHLIREEFPPHGVERLVADGYLDFNWNTRWTESTVLVPGGRS